MADRSLLQLEKTWNNTRSSSPISLRVPSVARLPADSDQDDKLLEFAETLLNGAGADKLDDLKSEIAGFISVTPEPGICVKLKTKDQKKIFMNICVSDRVPPLPKEISDEELAVALQSADITFRVPMSIGEPHEELDHSAATCLAYDIVVHSKLFKRIQESELFYHFFVSIAIEGLEEKFSLEINRDSVSLLKGKKVFGKILEQRIRTKPRLISEVDNSGAVARSLDAAKASPSDDIFAVPEHSLWLEDKKFHVEIELPLANSMRNLDLSVADDRVRLISSCIMPKNYHLQINLPMLVDSSMVDAWFERKKKVLHIGVPLKS